MPRCKTCGCYCHEGYDQCISCEARAAFDAWLRENDPDGEWDLWEATARYAEWPRPDVVVPC